MNRKAFREDGNEHSNAHAGPKKSPIDQKSFGGLKSATSANASTSINFREDESVSKATTHSNGTKSRRHSTSPIDTNISSYTTSSRVTRYFPKTQITVFFDSSWVEATQARLRSKATPHSQLKPSDWKCQPRGAPLSGDL